MNKIMTIALCWLCFTLFLNSNTYPYAKPLPFEDSDAVLKESIQKVSIAFLNEAHIGGHMEFQIYEGYAEVNENLLENLETMDLISGNRVFIDPKSTHIYINSLKPDQEYTILILRVNPETNDVIDARIAFIKTGVIDALCYNHIESYFEKTNCVSRIIPIPE